MKTWLRTTSVEDRTSGLCRISVHRNKVKEKQEIANKVINHFVSQSRLLQLLITRDVLEMFFTIVFFCQGVNKNASTGTPHSVLEASVAWRMGIDPTTFFGENWTDFRRTTVGFH